MTELIAFGIMCGGVALIVVIVLFAFKIADCIEGAKTKKLHTKFPTIFSLIKKRNNLQEKQIYWWNTNFAPLGRKINELRNLLPTATDIERKKLCPEIDALQKEFLLGEQEKNQKQFEIDKIHKMILTEKEKYNDKKLNKYLERRGWHE